MARLKRATRKVEILEVGDSKVHAVKPDKATWDLYTEGLFERNEKGDIAIKAGSAISALYRLCVVKVENVEVESADGTAEVKDLTDVEEIVEFLSHISNVSAGREIDSWLLGISDLSREEAKNSNGGPDASSSSPSLPQTSTASPA